MIQDQLNPQGDSQPCVLLGPDSNDQHILFQLTVPAANTHYVPYTVGMYI